MGLRCSSLSLFDASEGQDLAWMMELIILPIVIWDEAPM